MDITPEEISKKKQELGLEPGQPSNGPEDTEVVDKDTLKREESEKAERAVKVDFQDTAGTNDHNQYRYGGERP